MKIKDKYVRDKEATLELVDDLVSIATIISDLIYCIFICSYCYSSVYSRRVEALEVGVHIGQFLIEGGANGRTGVHVD